MSLRVVDKLVREGKYRQAMRALDRARELYPDNPYIPAYEERLRGLLNRQSPRMPQSAELMPTQDSISAMSSAPLSPELPSVEGQINSIAVSISKPQKGQRGSSVEQSLKRQEERRLALQAKITSLLRKACEYLENNEFDKALQEIWRASLLDPTNPEVLALEARAKSAKEDALLEQKAERERREKEEESVREQRRQEELAQLQREEEERQRIEEEARKNAEQTKIRMCLSQARALLEGGRFKEAETELSFALVIEPTHAEALALLEEIRRRAEEARLAEIECLRQEEEKQRIEQERIRTEVSKAISSARQSADRKDFQGALGIVTRACVLDPANADLQACEREIVLARDEWARQQEEEKRKQELELQEKREKERRQHEEEERLRVIKERLAQVEARRQASEREMNRHLQRATELLNLKEFEKALAEVALAFKANPLAQEVKKLEQLVLQAQAEAASAQEQETPEAPEEDSVDPEILARIASHLAAATDFASRNEYTKAFDEIAQAYAMDPLDETIEECERNIQGMFTQFLEHQNSGQAAQDKANHAQPAMAPAPPPAPTLATPEPAIPGTVEGDLPEEPANDTKTGLSLIQFFKRKRGLTFGLAATTCIAVAFAIVTTTRPSSDAKASTAAPTNQSGPSQEGQLQAAGLQPSAQTLVPKTGDKTNPPGRANHDITGTNTAKSGTDSASRDAAQKPQTPADAAAGDSANQTGNQLPQTSEPMTTQADLLPERMVQNIAALQTNPLDMAPAEPPRVAKPAEVVRLQKPIVSIAAEKMGAQGEVIVRVEIGEDGKPLSASIVRSSNSMLNDAVIDAVMNSEYKAGISASGESSTWLTIPFNFVK
jgi:TonB family protein